MNFAVVSLKPPAEAKSGSDLQVSSTIPYILFALLLFIGMVVVESGEVKGEKTSVSDPFNFETDPDHDSDPDLI